MPEAYELYISKRNGDTEIIMGKHSIVERMKKQPWLSNEMIDYFVFGGAVIFGEERWELRRHVNEEVIQG